MSFKSASRRFSWVSVEKGVDSFASFTLYVPHPCFVRFVGRFERKYWASTPSRPENSCRPLRAPLPPRPPFFSRRFVLHALMTQSWHVFKAILLLCFRYVQPSRVHTYIRSMTPQTQATTHVLSPFFCVHRIRTPPAPP